MTSTNNKRIAKNTLYLFIRKIVSLALSLYTARLLLKALGVDDFGLYGVVGSIVAIFSSLRGLFSSSIQRFINIEKGKGNKEEVQKIFSQGLKIQVYISIIFFIAAEIAAIIAIPYLNLPDNSYWTAQIVFQFSLLASIAGILTVPYDALIIANEKLDAYAFFSIAETILRLGIVVLLFIDDGSRIILYSILVFIVAALMRLINMIYCKHKFHEEARYKKCSDRKLLKKIGVFAGWQFLGNTGYGVQQSAINFLLNIYGGVVANAARSIAFQIMSAVTTFVNDVNVSFQPRTMMEYSQGNMNKFLNLLYLSAKASFFICTVIAVPIIIYTPSILKMWLGNVPDGTVIFTRWIMLYLIIRSLHCMFDLLFKTYGLLNRYQSWEFFCLLLNIPLAWIALRSGYELWSVFAIMCIIDFINIIVVLFIARYQLNFNITNYFNNIVLRVIIASAILSSIIYLCLESNACTLSTASVLIRASILAIVSGIITLFTVFNLKEIKSLSNLIFHFFVKKNK